MISESHYWKEPLLEMALRLDAMKKSHDLTDEKFAQIERDIFIGFYSVRKLFETPAKLKDATKLMTVHLEWYPAKELVTWRNKHEINEVYDLAKAKMEKRDVVFVCGRIIHSFIFKPFMDDIGLAGIMFTSDIDKHSKLYSMKIDDVIHVFKEVGNDYPSEIHWYQASEADREVTIVK